MRHIWSVICRSLLEDKISGKSSLIDITERISFKGDPPDERPITLPFPVPLHVVSSWRRESEECTNKYPCRLRIVSPSGEVLRTMDFEVNLEDFVGMHTFGRIDDLPFTVSGIYEFELAYCNDEDWVHVAQVPLEVIHEQPEPEQPESEPTD